MADPGLTNPTTISLQANDHNLMCISILTLSTTDWSRLFTVIPKSDQAGANCRMREAHDGTNRRRPDWKQEKRPQGGKSKKESCKRNGLLVKKKRNDGAEIETNAFPGTSLYPQRLHYN